jgi:hypothetical protein
MKMIDDFLVPESTAVIAPPAVLIQPENGIFFWNDNDA